jgi:hypothetical protein
MFNLFKIRTKQKSELDFFKQFFHSYYVHFVKIHFPIVIYPELPSQPKNEDWVSKQQYIIENLISETFKQDFEVNYLNLEGKKLEIIEKKKNGYIDVIMKQALVNQFLESQPKIFLTGNQLDRTNHKFGDFNVFKQYLDNTPDDILKNTFESIQAEFPDSQIRWKRFNGIIYNYNLKELLKDLSDIDPLNHLDRIYDEVGNWELLQPEENSFLLLGTNSNNLLEQLRKKELDIEIVVN